MSESKSPSAKSTESSSSSDSKSADSGSSGAGTKTSAPARSTSYFSSVSTDDYRSGWENIFGGNGKPGKKAAKPAKSVQAKSNGQELRLPITVDLDADDLDAAARAALLEAVRRRARKDKLKLGRSLSTGSIDWTVSCTISK